jgi:hypothetical protein
VSTDLLDGGRPKRLILSRGRWFLEMTRLVSTGDGVFQPRRHRIEGKAAIVETLRRSRHGQAFVDSATRIVASGEAGGDTSFEALDGAWVPSRLAPSYITQLGHSEKRTAAEAALIAELTVLRASHEGLMARVARLERMLANTPGAREHAFVAPNERTTHEKTPYAATLRGGMPPPSDVPDEAADEANAHAPDYGSEPEEPDDSGVLRFPPLGLVTDALTRLCGQDIPLKEMRGAEGDFIESPARYHASWVVDETDEVVGGFLFDSEVIARLGGALLATPQADIETQAASEQPRDDALSAASDICNTLSKVFTEQPGNQKVHARSPVSLADAPPDWLFMARRKLVCAHPGGGAVVFLAR